MYNLDDSKNFAKFDPKGLYNDIVNTPEQIESTWSDCKKFVIPSYYLKAKNIVISGMGGSGIGGEIVKDLSLNQCKIPIVNIGDYEIPAFVNSESLVMGVSFSGSTEETLSTIVKASEKEAKCIGIASGSKLESLSKKFSFPFFKIKYEAIQPRVAFGSLSTAIAGILAKLGFLNLSDQDIDKTINLLKDLNNNLKFDTEKKFNPAKKLAEKIGDRIPVIIGSGYLAHVAVRWKRNFNENSNYASYSEILPEMNHNSLVGLDYPKKLTNKIFFIILRSSYDHPRNILRQNIIQQIFKQKKIDCELVSEFKIGNPFSEIMQFVLFSDYVSYYQAILNGVDPEDISIIKFLKEQLSKQK